jgi:actin-related protein
MTHCIFAVGGDANVVVASLDEGAFLVGPSWVVGCEAAQSEVPVLGHEWKEEEALRVAEGVEEEEEEEEKSKPAAPKKKKARKRKARRRAGPVVVRDENGAVVLPLTLGTLTVNALGVLEGLGASFHSEDALYPVGFVSESVRPSYKHPATKVKYTFSIEAGAEGVPQFRVVCAHDLGNPIVGASSTEVCMRVASLLAEAKGEKAPSRGPKGNDWFGLSNLTMRELLQQLPGAEGREGYKRLNVDEEEEEAEEQQEEEEKPTEAVNVEEQQLKKKQKKKTKSKAAAAPEVRAAKRAEKDAARAKREEEEAAKRSLKAIEEEKRMDRKRQEQEKKKVEAEKRQQEQEAKKREREEAAAKKEAGQMKLTLVGVVVKKEEPAAAPPTPVLAVPRLAPPSRLTPDVLKQMIVAQQQEQVDEHVPVDYLEWARKQRGTPLQGRAKVAVRTLRFWDDNFRPAFSVLAASFRAVAPLSGRKPHARLAARDYEDESDDDWEGWDEQEESLGGEDDAEEAEEQAEEDEKGFVVPDTMIELEDGEVVSDVQTLPPRAEARRRVPLVCVGSLPQYFAVPMCAMPVAPSARPSEWPAASSSAPVDGVATLDATAAPVAKAKKQREGNNKKPLLSEATACLRAALEQQVAQNKSKVIETAFALFEQRHAGLPRPSKLALVRGLAEIAEYNGKTWVPREQLKQTTLEHEKLEEQ